MTRKRRGRPLTVDEERDKDQATVALVNSILDKKPVCCTPGKDLCSCKTCQFYCLFSTHISADCQHLSAMNV